MAAVAGPALVVGGASGIGRACVEALAADGRRTVVFDLNPGDLEDAVALDVRDRDAVFAAVGDLVASRGELGAVVYAAGTARVTPILEVDPREWELILGVNLTGAFHVLQATAPHIAAGGSFTAVSSIDSRAPVPGLAPYCASKAGLEALIRSAALELGPAGIRCNAVLPGLVRTPLMEGQLRRPGVEEAFIAQTPLRGIAGGGEVADVVAFLAGPGGRWITGASIPVDGGMSLTEHPKLH
ncbi:MAG TPA: SDR family NAD(P)-dependent oxidoreductase [Solirubrobacterales bacterium]|nr:SDR family NAD(P)-dependent oxidoreductase [Solirubrobacterales bacterium]